MAVINFPDPAGQTPLNTFSPTSTPSATSNGMTYKWSNGSWTITSSADDDAVIPNPGGPDNQPGTLDDRYVKLVGGTEAQEITGTGGLKTQGLLESEGGVEVSGGSLPTSGLGSKRAGIFSNGSGSISLYATHPNSEPFEIFSGAGTRIGLMGNADRKGYVHISGNWNPPLENNTYALWVNPTSIGTEKATAIRLVATRFPDISDKGAITQIRHFSNHNTNTSLSDVYGYMSSISNGADGVTNRYNFYAEGSAPNYFAGKTFSSINPTNENITGEANIYTKCASSTADDSGIEIISTNSNNNNARKAIRFTKVDYTGSESTAEAGFIQILAGVGGASGLQINGGTNGSVTWTSDYRLKSDIVSISSAADKIKQLNPVNYTIAGISNVNGFIAHELQEHVPQAVIGIKDETKAIGTLTDYDGTVLRTEVDEPSAEELTYTEEVETDGVTTQEVRTRTWSATGTRPVYQGVDQTKLIPLLTKALQEALDKIETLETRLSDAGIA